jgi:hypothetical protein
MSSNKSLSEIGKLLFNGAWTALLTSVMKSPFRAVSFFNNPPYVTIGYLLSISVILGFSFGLTGIHLPYIGNGDLSSENISFNELGADGEDELGADDELGAEEMELGVDEDIVSAILGDLLGSRAKAKKAANTVVQKVTPVLSPYHSIFRSIRLTFWVMILFLIMIFALFSLGVIDKFTFEEQFGTKGYYPFKTEYTPSYKSSYNPSTSSKSNGYTPSYRSYYANRYL